MYFLPFMSTGNSGNGILGGRRSLQKAQPRQLSLLKTLRRGDEVYIGGQKHSVNSVDKFNRTLNVKDDSGDRVVDIAVVDISGNLSFILKRKQSLVSGYHRYVF